MQAKSSRRESTWHESNYAETCNLSLTALCDVVFRWEIKLYRRWKIYLTRELQPTTLFDSIQVNMQHPAIHIGHRNECIMSWQLAAFFYFFFAFCTAKNFKMSFSLPLQCSFFPRPRQKMHLCYSIMRYLSSTIIISEPILFERAEVAARRVPDNVTEQSERDRVHQV